MRGPQRMLVSHGSLSFHTTESSIVGLHIEKKVTKHCKTFSHSSGSHKNKKDGPRTCALCPDQLCNDNGKNLPCICKDHISSEISGDCKVSNPKYNILVLQLPQFQDKDPTDNSLVSFLVGTAFLHGKLHNLSVSQLVKQFLKYTKDAGHLLHLKLENPNPSDVIEVEHKIIKLLIRLSTMNSYGSLISSQRFATSSGKAGGMHSSFFITVKEGT